MLASGSGLTRRCAQLAVGRQPAADGLRKRSPIGTRRKSRVLKPGFCVCGKCDALQSLRLRANRGRQRQISGDRQALLFMLVNLSRVFLADAILAKLHIHRLSVSDNLYLPGAPPPKRFEPVAYLIRLEFG